ncbi:23S rRNA pseudouridine(955/2504/2580) synthase RluC [Sedimenticola sp.]|uniref:23S rRNA pseudouridine(955/2504/2580) synthase RluC n=1 Tax=Sedimenticola sp. TaxID=1940285 RepID=UPI0025876075|nr:23S rRNA pseudouridine(955/2504/2580) synthase RluC [Sedimenticola sp.]MCW8902518.1 23S rRNA pseudouridine(955/2504/2580) synthase RluC [Sedimenticola sp.]
MSNSQPISSTVHILNIESGYEGQRIDNFLINHLKGVPKSLVYRILRRGEVRVNKGRIKANYRLRVGDQVRVPPVRMAEKDEPGRVDSRQLDRLEKAIIFEDKRLLVLNKPSGVAVHGGSGLSFGVIEALRQLRPEERQLELVHRLDRETSGCLLIAKRRSALRTLHELMRSNGIDKRYIALVKGRWRRDRIEVDAPLLKNTLQGGERVVVVDPRGKESVTRFSVRERMGDFLLIEARLMTGRTHQIRVHAAHLGTPILGDEKYGDASGNREAKELGLRRLFLHAETLRFRWPDEKQDQLFRAPLEPALDEPLTRIRAKAS